MPTELILAFDQGTTSSRALVTDAAGRELGLAQEALAATYPQSGWIEQDAEAIWSGQLRAARAALQAAGCTAADIAGIGITNQRETTILWDRRTGRPAAPAIVWQDRRSAAIVAGWRQAGQADRIRELTGLEPDAYFSASKIRWLLDRDPELQELAAAGRLAFGTVDSWLLYRLTAGAVHATDVTNASRTLLFDTERMEWSAELLDLFGIPRELLPEVKPTMCNFGVAAAEHFGAEIPVLALAGDQHAASFGQACFEPGMSKNTYGTGCFMLQNTGSVRRTPDNGLLGTVAWQLPAADPQGEPETTYAIEGSVFNAGAVIQWLRDGLGLISDAAAVNDLAASVPDNGDVYLVPAFTGLGAPHWDPLARGTITGLSRGTTGGHLARAALEGIALQVAEVFQAF
ncbi:MAG TPA: glycerol kinase GlpK, partial [Deinococcales bacterium]|nr:glycerol kinase GlpK [Deinococcales bacterium]